MGSAPNRPGWAASPMVWVILGFAVFPFIPFVGRYLSLATEVVIWSLFAIGFNILLGYTGLLSFGHGMFLGMGMYGATLIQIHPRLLRYRQHRRLLHHLRRNVFHLLAEGPNAFELPVGRGEVVLRRRQRLSSARYQILLVVAW